MDSVLYKPRNEGLQIQLRRYRDALALSGSMVIVLSVWDIIKLFISFFLGENTISEIIESIMAQGAYEVAGAGHEKVMRALLWAGFMVVILIFSLVIFLFHYYIGMSAFRTGRQIVKKDKRFYLTLTVFCVVVSAVLIILNSISFMTSTDSSANVDIAFFIMEVTAFINYIFILYAAGKIKKLEKAGA